MADAKAEEPCEAERRDPGIEAFQCAAEYFRAHVDAEGHLQRQAAA